MKVRALASISGPQGNKAVGDEFALNAADAQELISLEWVEAVETETLPPKDTALEKPAKSKAAAEE